MQMHEGWNNFLNEVRETNLPIVCFGAGMMPLFIEPLFEINGLWNRIEYFIDNDEKKEGMFIGEYKKKPVITLKSFREIVDYKFILLITCETFIPIYDQLQEIKEWEDVSCYAYPILNYDVVANTESTLALPKGNKNHIPKRIHYCWFGNGKMGELQNKCIQSWKEKCPDYEIVEWNEKNYDIHKNQYMREAYESKKWAYVSDFARLDILYDHGGIYLDTDVELLDSLDGLITQKAFIAYGEWPAINSGAGIGSIEGHPLVLEMRDNPRKDISFLNADGSCNMTQNCVYESRVLREHGLIQDFTLQFIDDFLILPPGIIATDSILGKDKYVTEKTIAIHHCGGSWADKKRMKEMKQTIKVCRG